MEILEIILPIFLIIATGYFFRRIGIVKEEWLKVLNSYAYYIALPAVIVSRFWQINWKNNHVAGFAVENLVWQIVLSVILFLALRAVNIQGKTKAAIFMLILVGNTIYIGLPLSLRAFRLEAADIFAAGASVQLVLGLAFSVLAIEYFISKKTGLKKYFVDFFKNPLVSSMIVGFILGLIKPSGFAFDIAGKIFADLGATATPVALLVLGSFFHGKFRFVHLGATLFLSGAKLVLIPLIAFLFYGLAFGPGTKQELFALIAVMPSAASCFVLAEEYGLEENFVANAILLCTLLSFFVLLAFLFFVK